MPRFAYLDFSRAVAAFAVANFHLLGTINNGVETWQTDLETSTFLTDGHGAVSFFFVLSGFVLSAQNKPIVAFYVERFFRIYPSYAVTLFVSVCTIYSSASALTILQSVFLFGGSGTFYPLVFQGWTLVYEFMFAAFLPFLRPDAIQFHWFFLVYILSMAYFGAFNTFTINTSYFFMGMATRKHLSEMTAFASRHMVVAITVTVVLYHARLASLVLVPLVGRDVMNQVVDTLTAVGSSFLIALITIIPVCRATSVLDTIGGYSFGIYLWHVFIIHILPSSPEYYPLFLLCTVACAILMHHLVEVPMIAVGRRIAKWITGVPHLAQPELVPLVLTTSLEL